MVRWRECVLVWWWWCVCVCMCVVVLFAVAVFVCCKELARLDIRARVLLLLLLLCFVVSVCANFSNPKCVYSGTGGRLNARACKNLRKPNTLREVYFPDKQLTGTRFPRSAGISEAGGGDATHSPGGEGVTPDISRNAASQEEAGANEGCSRRGGGAARAARPRTAWNSGVMEEDVERNGALAGGRRVDYCLQVIRAIVRRRCNNTW